MIMNILCVVGVLAGILALYESDQNRKIKEWLDLYSANHKQEASLKAANLKLRLAANALTGRCADFKTANDRRKELNKRDTETIAELKEEHCQSLKRQMLHVDKLGHQLNASKSLVSRMKNKQKERDKVNICDDCIFGGMKNAYWMRVEYCLDEEHFSNVIKKSSTPLGFEAIKESQITGLKVQTGGQK